jgi:hypothetical protein
MDRIGSANERFVAARGSLSPERRFTSTLFLYKIPSQIK